LVSCRKVPLASQAPKRSHDSAVWLLGCSVSSSEGRGEVRVLTIESPHLMD
jgi:hypothetical protein